MSARKATASSWLPTRLCRDAGLGHIFASSGRWFKSTRPPGHSPSSFAASARSQRRREGGPCEPPPHPGSAGLGFTRLRLGALTA
jgi:hypothetical protein